MEFNMNELTHFNKKGEAYMVNVGEKIDSNRMAKASGYILMKSSTLKKIIEGTSHKGDVLAVARIAGIQASKKTSELIPLCHPIFLNSIEVNFIVNKKKNLVKCIALADTYGKTGVEMEAITAVSVSLITIYDMCKSIDRGMEIKNIMLEEKKGGKSGHWLKKK